MSLQALATPKFLRKTQLAPNEYRKNFRQLDCDAIAAVTSPAAKKVTGLMSHIYLNLANAPARWWERDGLLHFTGEVRGDKVVTAWDNLIETTGVADKTLSKAVKWMHAQGVIGYHAAKNGVGIRIFLNRATNSIGTRPAPATAMTTGVPEFKDTAAPQKILPFTPAAFVPAPASPNATGFRGSLEKLDTEDKNPVPEITTCVATEAVSAPSAGASDTLAVSLFHAPAPNVLTEVPASIANTVQTLATTVSLATPETAPSVSENDALAFLSTQVAALQTAVTHLHHRLAYENQAAAQQATHLHSTLAQLKQEAVAGARQAAGNAAAEAVRCEYARNREWWETRALPKAVRVAQRECYDLLRQQGVLQDQAGQLRAKLAIGRQEPPAEAPAPPPAHARSLADIRSLAEICAGLHDTQGSSLEMVSEQLCASDGSLLLASDRLQVRELAQHLIDGREAMSNPFLLPKRLAEKQQREQS